MRCLRSTPTTSSPAALSATGPPPHPQGAQHEPVAVDRRGNDAPPGEVRQQHRRLGTHPQPLVNEQYTPSATRRRYRPRGIASAAFPLHEVGDARTQRVTLTANRSTTDAHAARPGPLSTQVEPNDGIAPHVVEPSRPSTRNHASASHKTSFDTSTMRFSRNASNDRRNVSDRRASLTFPQDRRPQRRLVRRSPSDCTA